METPQGIFTLVKMKGRDTLKGVLTALLIGTVAKAGNLNSTSTRSITLITSQTNITLNTGWNLIALNLSGGDTGTDRNISLVAGWNLIGYSSDVETGLSNAKFTNSSGSSFTWANAVANNKVQAYLAYYDTSSALASGRKYKYTATSDLGMDDTSFRKNKGYWLYANEAGNLTIPSIGGSLSGATYAWSKLRFMNSSGYEANITDVGSIGQGLRWITTTFRYWDYADPEDPGAGFDFIPISSGNLNSWKGYFVYSNYNNITLIRQN